MSGFVGKYGELRRSYLRSHRQAEYSTLLGTGKLEEHLLTVERESKEMLKDLMDKMLKTNPPPDKMEDQLGWVSHMNSIQHSAEEIILNELIYN